MVRYELPGKIRKKLENAWYGLRRRHGVRPGDLFLCERWQQSFAAFVEDVGPPPWPNAVLCMIDRAQGWQPANVRWGTWAARQQTCAHARILTADGRSQSLSAWANELGILPRTLRERLQKVPPPRALVPKLEYRPPAAPRPKSPHRASVFRGVYFGPRKWQARLRMGGVLRYLGLFVRETDAARAVERARLEQQCLEEADLIRAHVDRGACPEVLLPRLRELMALSARAIHLEPHWPRPEVDPARLSTKFHPRKPNRRPAPC